MNVRNEANDRMKTVETWRVKDQPIGRCYEKLKLEAFTFFLPGFWVLEYFWQSTPVSTMPRASRLNMWLSDTTYSATIISTDTIIAVPAGVYQCYQYRIFRKNGEGAYTDEFISPQHGWIKMEAYSKIGLQESRFKANSRELLRSVIH